MRWNWRGFLARYGIYQYLNYIRKLYFQKPRTIEQYKYLAEGRYLTRGQAEKLINKKLKNKEGVFLMEKVDESEKEVEYSVFLSCSYNEELGGHLRISDTSELVEIVANAKKQGIDELTLVKIETTREHYTL